MDRGDVRGGVYISLFAGVRDTLLELVSGAISSWRPNFRILLTSRMHWAVFIATCRASTMATDDSEPRLIGHSVLRSLSRAAGLLLTRNHQDPRGIEPRKITRSGAAVGIDLVNGKLLQTIHGISLIQVCRYRFPHSPVSVCRL